MLDKVIAGFITLWLSLIALVTVFDFIGIFRRAPTVWSGFLDTWDEVFNYKLYLTIMIVSSPALLAIWWKQRRSKNRSAEHG
jgi:hypothetical protein